MGKKGGRSMRDEGLQRTDNSMDLTCWPQVAAINQKNYYTDYLKRDDQILAYRLQNEENRNRMAKAAKERDRAFTLSKPNELQHPEEVADADATMADACDEEEENVMAGSKTVVIHVGSQNLRIGLASDALPKTIPMVIAHRSDVSESEENNGEPKPKRMKMDDGELMEPEQMFGPEFGTLYTNMCTDLRVHMRQNKRRTLPNSKEMVVNYNRRTPPETISEHNDAMRVEWTEIPSNPALAPEYVVGEAALRIPDLSKPRYKLYWPLRNGWCNEKDYNSKNILFLDIARILEDAMKTQLNLSRDKDWGQYSCVFIIPDLYEKLYVTQILDTLMRELGFGRVCFVQESLAGTFGAGYTAACVVDVGAQKTSICCVEEGMCVENSRINLKYGGSDVTDTFIKMMLFDHFPYDEINLNRRYDFLLAEELKKNVATLNETNVSVQVFDFHLRVAGQDTRKYTFKAYDEIILAPMGIVQPDIFDNSQKLIGRRKLINRSYDLYDRQPNDPSSTAQAEIIAAISPPPAELNGGIITNGAPQTNESDPQATPSRSQAHNALNRLQDIDATPRSSAAGSPAPDTVPAPQGGTSTPLKVPGNAGGGPSSQAQPAVEMRDDILAVWPLEDAIFTSITHAARGEPRKFNDFVGGVLVIGGGSLVSGFHAFLEERMQLKRPDIASHVMVGSPPRELDPQVVVWKGASVFGKLDATNDSWIGRVEYDRLGSRVMTYKCMWQCSAKLLKKATFRSGLRVSKRSLSQDHDWHTGRQLCAPTNSLLAEPARIRNVASANNLQNLPYPPELPDTLLRTKMSKSKDSGPAGGYHQEYIASLRYRNDLPPPEMPPKFLDIPHEGLERFLTAGFASNMVRREEPNIDVDAEGGMPIDLIGIPGLHLGDESAIMAPENPPPVDSADLPLLMSLDQLRNPAPKNVNVSFLRRTQYIASGGMARGIDSKGSVFIGNARKGFKPKPSRDDPTYVKKYIQKGFDIAYPKSKHIGPDTSSRIQGLTPTKADLDAWANPVHPDNPKLKPVGLYPVIPDVDGFPDSGGFLQFKFDKTPLPPVNGRRDERMDMSILIPSAPEPRVLQDHLSKTQLYKANPALYTDPGPVPYDYDLYLPQKQTSTKLLRRSFNMTNPDRDDPSNYAHENANGDRYHHYDRLRTYATNTQALNTEHKYKDVSIVLFDPAEVPEGQRDSFRLSQKGAYYYPIISKTRIKPERSQKIARAGLAPTRATAKEDQVDQIQLKLRDPIEEESHKRAGHRSQIDSGYTNPFSTGDSEKAHDSIDAQADEEMVDNDNDD